MTCNMKRGKVVPEAPKPVAVEQPVIVKPAEAPKKNSKKITVK